MTNFKKIRSMSAEEMAEVFYNLSNYGEYCAVPYAKCYCKKTETCKECCLIWLNEEADND